MGIAPDLPALALDAGATNPALAQHLDELIAELRDRGITPQPLNILHYALELGLSGTVAAELAALLERNIRMGDAQ
jgi:hypothetical protein